MPAQSRWRRPNVQGSFLNNAWHCDCNPPVPAVHFKVTKDSENKGRWFYTCQYSKDPPNGEPKRCKFFLWEDDARVREAATVMANRHDEPAHHTSANASSNKPQSANPDLDTDHDSSSQRTITNSPNKSTREGDAISSNQHAVPASIQTVYAESQRPSTPTRQPATASYVTPTSKSTSKRKFPWDQVRTNDTDLTVDETPSLAATPSKHTRTDQVMPSPPIQEAGERMHHPQLSRSVHFETVPQVAPEIDESLSVEVLSILSSINLPRSITAQLRNTLDRQDLRMRGIVKGREISRSALKAREARITELESKIARLEAERDADQKKLQFAHWRLDNELSDDNLLNGIE